MDAKARADLLREAATRGARYVDGLAARRVAPAPAAVAALEGLAGPLPERGRAPGEVLRLLDELGSPATVASAGPRYFGFVTGGVLPAALAASWLAAAWDQNAFSHVSSPVAARLEEITLGWLLNLLHLPAGAAAGFVTGATMANFTALAAARHAVLARAGFDVEAQGLAGAPAITVIVGEQVHASVMKVIALLGLGRERVVRVAADEQGRLRVDRLPEVAGPTIVLTQAGNVNSGAFDAVGEVCDRVQPAGAWVHVDGAFGLWAAASPAHRALTAGVERADSWACDAHKWLNVSYDSGIAVVRDALRLRAAMSVDASYLHLGDAREPLHYTPESSRRARGVEIWAALASLGREGVAALVEMNCRQARTVAARLAAAGHEVLNEVVLNQVLVRFGDDARTRRVVAAVQAGGECWCGATEWRGRAAMRVSVSSWATRDEDVERSVAAILAAAEQAG
ncbi:MAG: pyridoxal-dependent decarboxylase [Gammaproteobacteria bacterium]|nr:pyridoxal-dependent decarboxylase [Gammaproteobacteria bacterium]